MTRAMERYPHRNAGRRPTLAAPLLLVTLLAGAATTSCSDAGENRSAKQAPEPMTVRVTNASLQNVERGVDVTGSLFPNETISISAKVSGRIVSYQKDIGERVAPGEELARIDPTDYALEVTQKRMGVAETLAQLGLTKFPGESFDLDTLPTVRRAAQQAANAKARYERIKQLHEQTPPLVSDQDFADVETAWHVSNSEQEVARLSAGALLAEAQTRQAELEVAQQRLTDTKVVVPMIASGGTPGRKLAVASRAIAQGNYVREGDPLFRLVDDDPLRLRVQVPERSAGRVKPGQKVHITVQAHGSQVFTGQVTRISPEIDQSNRTFLIEAQFENPDRLLKAGAFSEARIITDEEVPAVFVPADAIVSFAGVHRVFTIAQGKAVEVRIELGERRGDVVQVVKGLKGDEPLVASPPGRMISGTPLVVESSSSGH